MSEPKIAWCHRANDNYYTDEQTKEAGFPLSGEILKRAYIKFIEHSAYLAMQARAELAEKQRFGCEAIADEKCRHFLARAEAAERNFDKLTEMSQRHATEYLEKIAAAERERDEWKEEYENVCKFTTDYEKERDQLRAQVAGLRAALERIADVRCAWQLSQEISKEALENFGITHGMREEP